MDQDSGKHDDYKMNKNNDIYPKVYGNFLHDLYPPLLYLYNLWTVHNKDFSPVDPVIGSKAFWSVNTLPLLSLNPY
jgi:hypothetical protein